MVIAFREELDVWMGSQFAETMPSAPPVTTGSGLLQEHLLQRCVQALQENKQSRMQLAEIRDISQNMRFLRVTEARSRRERLLDFDVSVLATYVGMAESELRDVHSEKAHVMFQSARTLSKALLEVAEEWDLKERIGGKLDALEMRIQQAQSTTIEHKLAASRRALPKPHSIAAATTGEAGSAANSPSHFAITTAARQLPSTFTAVRPMSSS